MKIISKIISVKSNGGGEGGRRKGGGRRGKERGKEFLGRNENKLNGRDE